MDVSHNHFRENILPEQSIDIKEVQTLCIRILNFLANVDRRKVSSLLSDCWFQIFIVWASNNIIV